MTDNEEIADCAKCINNYDSDVYPCDQCSDNPDIVSHYLTQQPRLANYFIGAPVMVKTSVTWGLVPYDGVVLAYRPKNVRLPTLQEAVARCPGLWLIPWPEMPDDLQYCRCLAWDRVTDRVIEYKNDSTIPPAQWSDIKAIQILPELRQ